MAYAVMLAMRAFIRTRRGASAKARAKVIEDDEAESPGRVSAGADDGRIIPGLAAAVVQSHSHRCQLWMTGRGLS